MTTEQHAIDNDAQTNSLLSRKNIKAYLLTMFGLAAIIALYYLLMGPVSAMPSPGGQPPGGPPNQAPTNGPGLGALNSWPLWGQLVIPTLSELAISIAVIVAFGVLVMYLYGRTEARPNIYLIVIIGVLLIIATNLIHGWLIGIEQPISGTTEIFNDMFRVESILDFISNYETIQPTLTTHAQTQPPGAVLSIYLLYLAFSSPSLVAIGLCIVAGVGSAFFIRGIFRQLFDEDFARYTTFLYLLLPAIQVYYLANIYALVATYVLGVLYFYHHANRRIAAVGSFLCLFLLTFITFLSLFMVFFLFVYEIVKSYSESKTIGMKDRASAILRSLKYPVILSLCVGLVYGLLLVTIGFNYINAFLYASSLENPNGFMLFSNPIEYFTSRIQDILDIAIFFGPVLSVLAYRGFFMLRDAAAEDTDASKKYHIVLSALIALGLLFLTGAPKKGETARICMFILPFLLIPVITYIQKTNMCRRDKIILLALVFGQAVLLQLLGIWVW